MDASRTHLTRLPPGFITVRIMQFGLSVAIVAVSTIAVTLSFDKASAEWGPLISAALTLTILIWMILATYKFPKAYNYWAVLSMEILLFLIWIDGFVWALGGAFSVGDSNDATDCNTNYDSATFSYTDACPDNASMIFIASNAAISGAALSACNMLLFFVSMTVVSVFIARHRAAGGHNKIGSLAPVYSVQADPRLLQQSELELRQQNLALQQQYLSLQQQHFELQCNAGVTIPQLAAGQVNMASGTCLEKEASVDWGSDTGGYPTPVQVGMPQMQQAQSGVSSWSGQQEVDGSEKGKERGADGQIMSGRAQSVVVEI